MKACTKSEWREICDQFRACVPAPEGWRWSIRRVSKLPPGQTGDCSRGTKIITIKVLSGMSWMETVDTLLHEAAHGFDRWDHHGWSGDHSDTFFIWFGRLYRRFHGVS